MEDELLVFLVVGGVRGLDFVDILGDILDVFLDFFDVFFDFGETGGLAVDGHLNKQS